MSKLLKTAMAVGFLAVLGACAQQGGEVEEFVVVDSMPITVEPMYTGKLN